MTALQSVQVQSQQWAWSRYRNRSESGTQEGRTYRGVAAERCDAAADVVDGAAVVAVVVADAGQKPVGTGAAVREGREGE